MKQIDIKTELGKNKTVLLLVPSIEYNEDIVEIMKNLSGKSVCYVSLNKTFSSINELFSKNKINTENVVFIDAISKTLKQVPSQTDKCYFVSSPGALTELSLVISKFLKHNFEYLIFDSITTLTIYEKEDAITRFLSSIINKIKESETNAAFYAVKIKDHDTLMRKVPMFVDKVIDLE